MSFIKILLIALGLILFGMLALSVVGFVYGALWYLFWIGMLAALGYVGYKMLKKDKSASLLEDKNTFSIGGMNEVNRAFEDFKRKHLTK
jgi:4-hydroxybenzoate polyprenyltransferase